MIALVALRDLRPFLPEDLWEVMKKYATDYNIIPVRYARKAREYWLRRKACCMFCRGPFEEVAHRIPHTRGVMEFGFNSDFLVMLWNTLPTCKRDNVLAEWEDAQILRFKQGLRTKLTRAGPPDTNEVTRIDTKPE